jgi:DNA-binding MarR family transcriptional regulator
MGWLENDLVRASNSLRWNYVASSDDRMNMAKATPWQLMRRNFEIMESVLAEAAPAVRALGLELKELFLLDKLDAHPHPAELARALMLPRPSVTFLVKRVEARGFVRRSSQADDLRRFRLTLTARGRQAAERARAILDRAFAARLARLSQAQRRELERILERMS